MNYSSSSTCNTETITISDITIATAPTTAIGHTASKEVELEGGRHNGAPRGITYWKDMSEEDSIVLQWMFDSVQEEDILL